MLLWALFFSLAVNYSSVMETSYSFFSRVVPERNVCFRVRIDVAPAEENCQL